jgi:hypothetical protein
MNQAHFGDDRDLLGDGLDATLRDNESEQHTPRNPENAFLKIEPDAVPPKPFEGRLEVGYEIFGSLGLNYDVIHVCLNSSPDEVPKTLEHTSLLCSPDIF